MGYNFSEAKDRKSLNDKQKERFDELYPLSNLPDALKNRIDRAIEYVGPINNGEAWAARNELITDAIVVWILAGEDPQKVQWLDLEKMDVPPPPLSEEEKARRKKKNDDFLRELNEKSERRRREYDEWERKHHPIRYFFFETLPRYFR